MGYDVFLDADVYRHHNTTLKCVIVIASYRHNSKILLLMALDVLLFSVWHIYKSLVISRRVGIYTVCRLPICLFVDSSFCLSLTRDIMICMTPFSVLNRKKSWIYASHRKRGRWDQSSQANTNRMPQNLTIFYFAYAICSQYIMGLR